jgi:c-di-GMP-binding flagellar brake protein YcgR
MGGDRRALISSRFLTVRTMDVEASPKNAVANPQDHRATPRLPVHGEASLLVLKHDCRVPCRVTDLSMGGCRIEALNNFVAGMQERVEVSFTVRGLLFRFHGITRWTDGRRLVGILFVEMTSRRKDELAELLIEVEQENAAKAAEQAFEKAAAGGLGPEEFTEEAELAEEAEPAQEVRRNPARHERRAQSRRPVDTSAVICLINAGSRLRGRILDLSLGGCRIRTIERFPVGIYTRVEVEFRLEGLPFRLAGVIQAVHDLDRFNVGIRFLDVSDRKRGQVERLMEEIEEMLQMQTGAGPEASAEQALEA